jgi:pyruvate/2-oxoglutarate dehydrogenase complex dihydrolipoamide dehydrogenase (E3) component
MTQNAKRYDAIILGTGQAGVPLATALAEAGWKTAIVERGHVGGSCINHGCTPTKTLVASARVAYLARRAADFGVSTGEVTVDLARVQQRQRKIVEKFRGGTQRSLEEADGVELIFGHGRFAGPRRVEVERQEGGPLALEAGRVFINTGTRAARPPIPGLDTVSTLDNVSILDLDELPRHLLVLGGGYIGVEYGQMFRRFGSRVTLLQRGERLLGREDRDVAEAVEEILAEDGVEIVFEAEVGEASRGADGGVALAVSTPAGDRRLEGSHLLLAAGRVPNSADLGLAAAGLETDERGFIRANERLETAVPGIYALGDVKGGPAFTHISYDDYRIVRANLLHGGAASTRGRQVPYTVFMDPQLGRVGLGEEEARVQGRKVRVARLPMRHAARAIEAGETRGFMKAVVDAETGQILGCAILGLEGGEVLAVLQTAMMGKLPYTAIREAIYSHPTLAESLNNLFMALEE